MDIFSIPDWGINKIGDTNANQLLETNVRTKVIKEINAKKIKKKQKKTKLNKKALSVNCHYSTAENQKKNAKNIRDKAPNKFVNKKQSEKANNSVTKIIMENNTSNIKETSLKCTKNITNKIQKQQMKRLKKRNKMMENTKQLTSKLQKDKHKIRDSNVITPKLDNNRDAKFSKIQNKKLKLIKLLNTSPKDRKEQKSLSLRERMLEKLRASRFRYINEQIYNADSKEIQQYFTRDPDAFLAYHEGYRQQVSKWPLNPLDVIIQSIKKMPSNYIIADLGCGEAKLSSSVPQKVHSFDLVAVNDIVTACDMSKVPLGNDSVDVVVFCLSLMGPNIKEYLFEASRILKNGGLLKVAEVESRFDTVEVFIEGVKRFGFVNTWKDLSHNLFYFLDFKKTFQCKSLHKLPTISLHPCLYKKR